MFPKWQALLRLGDPLMDWRSVRRRRMEFRVTKFARANLRAAPVPAFLLRQPKWVPRRFNKSPMNLLPPPPSLNSDY